MAKIKFYVECFDRDLIIEVKAEDKERVQNIMECAYDIWIENPEEVGDSCCEEYICSCIEAAGIDYKWINE